MCGKRRNFLSCHKARFDSATSLAVSLTPSEQSTSTPSISPTWLVVADEVASHQIASFALCRYSCLALVTYSRTLSNGMVQMLKIYIHIILTQVKSTIPSGTSVATVNDGNLK